MTSPRMDELAVDRVSNLHEAATRPMEAGEVVASWPRSLRQRQWICGRPAQRAGYRGPAQSGAKPAGLY
jgi:hypothetical protein